MRGRAYEGWTRPIDYVEEAGAWIHAARPWCVFASLTFAVDVNDLRADLAMNRWMRAVAKHFALHVTTVFASDYQRNGFLHFHALLAFETPIDCTRELSDTLKHLWKASVFEAGWTDFRRFDPTQGAAWYEAKHREIGTVTGCPRRRPRCRRGRCPHTSCPA
jgi:hypothetical protein